MEKEEKNKLPLGFKVGVIICSIIFVSIVSFAVYFYFTAPKEIKKEELDGGSINLTYSDDEQILTLSNLYGLTDEQGISLNSADLYFDFTIDVELDEASKIDYEISVIPQSNSTVPVNAIKVYLEKLTSGTYAATNMPVLLNVSKKKSDLGSRIGSMVIYGDTTQKSKKENYRLRAWVDGSAGYEIKPTDIISLKVEVCGKAS